MGVQVGAAMGLRTKRELRSCVTDLLEFKSANINTHTQKKSCIPALLSDVAQPQKLRESSAWVSVS